MVGKLFETCLKMCSHTACQICCSKHFSRVRSQVVVWEFVSHIGCKMLFSFRACFHALNVKFVCSAFKYWMYGSICETVRHIGCRSRFSKRFHILDIKLLFRNCFTCWMPNFVIELLFTYWMSNLCIEIHLK